jgi:hypothetical protein
MATLGTPAIPTPRALELRALQGTINNIRERIEKIESSSAVGATIEQFNNLTTQLGALRSQLAALSARVKLLEDAGVSDTVSLTAAETITQYAPVVPVGLSSCEMADPSDPNRMFGVVGIALNAASPGAAVTVQRRGPLTIPGAVYSVGRAVYASLGALTQTPNYEATAVPVGVAITSTAFWIAPDWPALLDRPFASAVDDAYLRYLPVTYSLVKEMVESFPISSLSYVSGIDGDELMAIERAGVLHQIPLRDLGGLGVDTAADVIVDNSSRGLVLKDTQGTPHYWRLTVSNVGALVTTDLGTVKP